jgi:hypothetical protein
MAKKPYNYLSTTWHRALSDKIWDGHSRLMGSTLFIASFPIQLLFYLGHTMLYPLRLIAGMALFPAQRLGVTINKHDLMSDNHNVKDGSFITADGIQISYTLFRSKTNTNEEDRKLFIPFSGNASHVKRYMDHGMRNKLKDYDILLFDMPRAGMNREAFKDTGIRQKIINLLPIATPHKLVNTAIAGIKEATEKLNYKNIELYAHSLGGSIAACAVAQLQAENKVSEDVTLRLLLDRTFSSLSKATEHLVASLRSFKYLSKPASWLVSLTGWNIRTEETLEHIKHDTWVYNHNNDKVIYPAASLAQTNLSQNGNIHIEYDEHNNEEKNAHNESIYFMKQEYSNSVMPVSILDRWLNQEQEPSQPTQH